MTWLPSLKYYKLHPDVPSPNFKTEGAACFDVSAFLTGENQLTAYTVDNKKTKFHCKRDTYLQWSSESYKPYINVPYGSRVLVPTGLIFDIPEEYYLKVYTRSSSPLKNGLMLANSTGIIDSDYIHELFLMLTNVHSNRSIRINHLDRLCQVEMRRKQTYNLVETDQKPEQKTDRTGGFGSTDKVSDGTYQPHLIDPKLFEQQTSVFKHKHKIAPK